ncbi:LysR family transcriptional regulator [Vibrio parahaemolyticus]|nr:LysR family transcriptional regulator [Vibrio parahaemolyticus]
MFSSHKNFDLNTLNIFRLVVELNSLSKAAEKLGINPSTVSRKIVELEAYYGVKLLHRTTRSLTLTNEGLLFLNYCQTIEELLKQSESEIMNAQLEPSGVLRIVTPVDLGNMLLQEPLLQFANAYPNIVLDLEFSNRTVNIIEEGIDVWFTVGQVVNQDLIAKTLLHYQRHLMASKSYLAKCGAINSLLDIEAPHKQLKSKSAFSCSGSQKSPIDHLPVAFTANNSYTLFKACVAGLGLSFIASRFIEQHDKEGVLVKLLENEVSQESTINMVYKDRTLKPKRTECFIDFIHDYF